MIDIKTIIKFIALFLVSAALIPASAQENPKLSDAEVASVAVVANQIDINYADIAKEKSRNSETLKFAETMTNDYQAVIAQASDKRLPLG